MVYHLHLLVNNKFSGVIKAVWETAPTFSDQESLNLGLILLLDFFYSSWSQWSIQNDNR